MTDVEDGRAPRMARNDGRSGVCAGGNPLARLVGSLLLRATDVPHSPSVEARARPERELHERFDGRIVHELGVSVIPLTQGEDVPVLSMRLLQIGSIIPKHSLSVPRRVEIRHRLISLLFVVSASCSSSARNVSTTSRQRKLGSVAAILPKLSTPRMP